MVKEIAVGNVKIGGDRPLVLVAGPCVIENEVATMRCAERLMTICNGISMPLIFKASYDKANRTSVNAFRGPGMKEGLRILQRVKESLGVPVLSDIHSIEQVTPAAEVLDILQIPAFLCRQTDLVVAAALSGRVVNIKKGQFLAPWDMENVVGKVVSTGNDNIILTERGVSFGYNNLVSDMRSFPIMRKTGYPVIFDATHSVQLPGGLGGSSGGQREFVEYLGRAAVATGIDGIFMEVHEEPEKALCDGPNSVRLDELPALLKKLKAIVAGDIGCYTLGVMPRDAPLLIWDDPQLLSWSDEEREVLGESEETRWLLGKFPASVHGRPEGGPGSHTMLVLWPYHVTPVEPVFPLPEDPDFPEMALRGFSAILPGLASYLERMPRAFVDGGYYTKTRENRLLVGPLLVHGAFMICGLSGYGVMSSCAAGRPTGRRFVRPAR